MLATVSSLKASCKAATVSLVMARALKRQLLADAMEAAATGQDVVGAQADGLAGREQGLERMDCGLVILSAVERDDNRRIADVKVHVARRNDFAIPHDLAWRGQSDEVELRVGKPPRRILEDGGIRVALGSGRNGDAAGRDEAGEVIYMAVRVIVEQSLAQPDELLETQVAGERFLNIGPVHAGIPIGVEQALLGGHDRARAVA